MSTESEHNANNRILKDSSKYSSVCMEVGDEDNVEIEEDEYF